MPEVQQFDFQPIQRIIDEIILFAPRLVSSFFIYIGFWLVSWIIGKVVRRYGVRLRLDEDIKTLFVRIVRAGILITGAITALGTLGVDVTALVAGLGLTSFALGFALQDIVSNVLSGVLILMYRPYRRGQYIRVGANEGYVIDIDLRYTTLERDNIRVLIPNSVMFRESIIVIRPVPLPPAN